MTTKYIWITLFLIFELIQGAVIYNNDNVKIQDYPHKDNNLLIGAFNIEVFGKSKMSDKEVVDVLEKILIRYDLVLIQEIRDSTGTAIDELLDVVNKASDTEYEYDMVISNRLGTTSSKEQYAYFYKKNKFTVLDEYQWPEDAGVMYERPPYTVRFRATDSELTEFGFMGIHTKPLNAPKEIDHLVDVYDAVSKKWNLKDIIIGGDLNAGCRYVTGSEWEDIRLKHDTRFMWVIGDDVDTTLNAKACPYDRLILAGEHLQSVYVANSATAYNFRKILNLNDDLAERTSDHFPVDMQMK